MQEKIVYMGNKIVPRSMVEIAERYLKDPEAMLKTLESLIDASDRFDATIRDVIGIKGIPNERAAGLCATSFVSRDALKVLRFFWKSLARDIVEERANAEYAIGENGEAAIL